MAIARFILPAHPVVLSQSLSLSLPIVKVHLGICQQVGKPLAGFHLRRLRAGQINEHLAGLARFWLGEGMAAEYIKGVMMSRCTDTLHGEVRMCCFGARHEPLFLYKECPTQNRNNKVLWWRPLNGQLCRWQRHSTAACRFGATTPYSL